MKITKSFRVMVRSKAHNSRWTCIGNFADVESANKAVLKHRHMYVRVDERMSFAL